MNFKKRSGFPQNDEFDVYKRENFVNKPGTTSEEQKHRKFGNNYTVDLSWCYN